MANHTKVIPKAIPAHACREVQVAIHEFQTFHLDQDSIGPEAAEIAVGTGNLMAQKCAELCVDGCLIKREIGSRLRNRRSCLDQQEDQDFVATATMVFALAAGPLDLDDLLGTDDNSAPA